MYGTNPVAKPRLDNSFLVHDIFPTIQGEGPWQGYPTLFIRMSGCNLRCFWCDTEFNNGEYYKLPELVATIRQRTQENDCRKVVLTGGEPMLQQIGLIAQAMPLHQFQVETAGSVWTDSLDRVVQDNLLIVCSPKTPNVHPMIARHCRHWKYIIRDGEVDPNDGLPCKSTQIAGKDARIFRPIHRVENTIWVQPCDEASADMNQRNLVAALRSARKFNYRLSVQLHKVLGLP